jgi:alkylhydroperoxidase family enzyme
MIRSDVSRRLAAREKRIGESLDYRRHMARVSLRAFFRFLKVLPISEYRRRLPAEPYHVARIVATRDEDCGTCGQIEVNLAECDGVASEVLRAVIGDRPEDLPPELADAYRFADAVVRATGEVEELRERVVHRWGEEGLVDLALAIGSSRFFPIVKRTLGYARSRKLVEIRVEGAKVG